MVKLFENQATNAVSTESIQWKFGGATLIVRGDLDGGTVAIQVCDTVDGTYKDVTDFLFTGEAVKQLPEFGFGLFIKAELRGSAALTTDVTVIVAPVATLLKATENRYSEGVFA